ncbi:uncharacterized protein LOC141620612 [Silene latifolia]|uniref:uncharacterized protein LOC141620612 n=1 Tax=Silene latifolia TaxID=37657 RepID=UPI003D774D48
MSKWSVHLSGYDIQYNPRTAMKSQALADFVSDFSPAIQNLADEEILALEGNRDPTELSSIPIAHILKPSIQKTNEINRGELEDQQDEVGVQTTTEAVEDSQPPDQPAIQADDWDWRTPYLDWLRHSKLPDDKSKVRAFRVKSSRFILIDDTLFRKSLEGPYLRCLDKEEAQTVLHALHSGECGNHAGDMSLSNKALR